ncbi:hypothetical protein ACFX2C_002996 [Malus domestica]
MVGSVPTRITRLFGSSLASGSVRTPKLSEKEARALLGWAEIEQLPETTQFSPPAAPTPERWNWHCEIRRMGRASCTPGSQSRRRLSWIDDASNRDREEGTGPVRLLKETLKIKRKDLFRPGREPLKRLDWSWSEVSRSRPERLSRMGLKRSLKERSRTVRRWRARMEGERSRRTSCD